MKSRSFSFFSLPFVLALLVVSAITITICSNETAQAAPGEVLILSTSVQGGASSYEANAVFDAGKVPVLVDAATWNSMTAADFANYDAIILGDRDCSTDIEACVGAAIDTSHVWGPEVDGNVIIIGSDPVYHANRNKPVAAKKLIDQGIAFALDKPEKTGAYIGLSCYYHFSSSGTSVPLLDSISGGGFSVIGASYLPGLNDVHIVATHPTLEGLTDADLSNWSNSVHEGFETWPETGPLQFEALAIARDPSGSYTAPDGSVGYPYILARGVTPITDISLSPDSAINPVETSHTLTATVTTDDPIPGTPVVGTDVTFSVIDGPHTGESGVGITNSDGQAIFSYVGTTVGIDTIEATFVDAAGLIQRSKRVTKEWALPDITPVAIDIKPQSCPNPLNVDLKGVLPVAILGAEDFDVTQVDVATVKLAGVSPLRSNFEDVATPFEPFIGKEDCLECTDEGPDGFPDLTLKFSQQAIAEALGVVEDGQCVPVVLEGKLLGGADIEGEDVVRILKKE